MLKLSHIWPVGDPSGLICALEHVPSILWELLYFLEQGDVWDSPCTFLSQLSLVPFSKIFRNQDLGAKFAHCYKGVIACRPLTKNSQEIYLYLYLHPFQHLSIYLSITTTMSSQQYLQFQSNTTGFILVFPLSMFVLPSLIRTLSPIIINIFIFPVSNQYPDKVSHLLHLLANTTEWNPQVTSSALALPYLPGIPF